MSPLAIIIQIVILIILKNVMLGYESFRMSPVHIVFTLNIYPDRPDQNVDPGQMASIIAVWSEPTLFAIPSQ